MTSVPQSSRTRIVVKKLGREVVDFQNTGQIVSAMADAVDAHTELHERAMILHRGVSVGNILITDDDSGILVDLDSELGAIQRMGTMQFESAKLQETSTPPPPSLADDLESFYHVLTWLALRYTDHGFGRVELSEVIKNYFDEFVNSQYYKRQYREKGRYLRIKRLSYAGFEEDELAELIDELASVLSVRYREEPSEEEIKEFEEFKVSWAEDLKKAKEEPNPEVIYEKLKEMSERAVERHAVARYRRDMERLENGEWMSETFRTTAMMSGEMLMEKVVHKLVDLNKPYSYGYYY
ncbi:hypothetical protein VNI00_018838 [Paramarasmius palmivorus]|uniref:Fungal-type protein kinase domain-containing protein n=1 Tax=Paramarasmius palmivorus TaxID=297713 RepID=A0AAW0AUG9_9AGAR